MKFFGRKPEHPPLTTEVRDPLSAEAHFNLGLARLDSGSASEAEAEFRTALALRNLFPEAWVGLAEVLETQGQYVEALTALDTALVQRPDYVGALGNASLLLQKMGRVRDAQARLDASKLIELCASGRHAEVETVSRQVIEDWPDSGLAWRILGATLALQGRFEPAVRPLTRALQLLPEDAETHHNLAIVLHALGRREEAEKSYRDAVRLRPGYHEAHNNLANLLASFGRHPEAEDSCRRSLELAPSYFEAHTTLGDILAALGRPSEALLSYRRALGINPGYHLAHGNLGASLVALGRLAEAEASCRKSLELKPDFPEGHHSLLFLLNYHPDKSQQEVRDAYLDFDARIGHPLRSTWQAHPNDRQHARRLRVGYVSPDFRKHAAQYFVEPLLDHHDKSVVEVFAYAQVANEDPVTARMKSRADHWVCTVGMDDARMVDRIRADKIDILVDLAGHTNGNRLRVFARKPAPVSVTSIGFGFTTGLSAIDWFLTDGVVVPQGAEAAFSEGLWRIPLCQVYRPAKDMGDVGSLPASSRGYITFGALTRAARINHRIVNVWAEILSRVPASKLLIDSLSFKDVELSRSLAEQFAAQGVKSDRLEIGFHSPPWDVMRGVDISLDCFPQNSGTTLFESLYMGIPFITKADRPSLGRLGASIASHAGHPEWVAANEQDYIEKAVTLATNVPHLSRIRTTLRSEITESLLMDEKAYVRSVEAAYRGMWKEWCLAH